MKLFHIAVPKGSTNYDLAHSAIGHHFMTLWHAIRKPTNKQRTFRLESNLSKYIELLIESNFYMDIDASSKITAKC